MFSRRSFASFSIFGFSIGAGHAPMISCQVFKISRRRFNQSSAVLTGLPSEKLSGDL